MDKGWFHTIELFNNFELKFTNLFAFYILCSLKTFFTQSNQIASMKWVNILCDGALWKFGFRSLLCFCLLSLIGLCSTSHTKSGAASIWFISLLEHMEVSEAVFVYCLQLQNSQTFLIRTINIIEWGHICLFYSCCLGGLQLSGWLLPELYVFHFPFVFATGEIL